MNNTRNLEIAALLIDVLSAYVLVKRISARFLALSPVVQAEASLRAARKS